MKLGWSVTARHLSREQKQRLIKDQLKETPEVSDRQIAKGMGVHQSTVGKQRKMLEESGEVSNLDTVTGQDGVEQPRHKRPAYRYEDPTPEGKKAITQSAKDIRKDKPGSKF